MKRSATIAAQSWREEDRLTALERYKIMDTLEEEAFDDIARIAAQVCGVPMALVSLLDDKRQWFKAKLGLSVSETPREWAFCDHAIRQSGLLEVQDAQRDSRFVDNPLVTGDPNLRFYAGMPLQTPDGFPLGTLCVLDRTPHELTMDQRETLEALARQVMSQLEIRRMLAQQKADEAQHRLILASATDYAIVAMDLQGCITSWNAGACQVLGWTEEEVLGETCDIFFTPEDNASGQVHKEMGAALRDGRGNDERWHLRKDGERFWANGEMMPLLDDDGHPVGFIKILRNRTEQKLSRERLEATERRYQLALEAADLGAWETTPDLSEVQWDARTRELFDLGPDEMVNHESSFLARLHPDDRPAVEAALAHALSHAGDGRLDIEYRIVDPTNKHRTIHTRGRLIETDGMPSRFVGTVRDVSARAAADEHRMLLANELKHRIKNTLSVVQGIVSQSLRTVASPAEARDAIGDRLAAMAKAHDLLTQTSWSAASITAIVEGAVSASGAHRGRVRVSGPELALNARAALALAMALHELTTNAIKYGALSTDLGQIEVRWHAGQSDGCATISIVWEEKGGPPVSVPRKTGFGSRLIGSALRGDLGGVGVSEYRPEGLRWKLVAERSAIEEK